MKVAAIQMVSGTSPERNAESAWRLIERAAQGGAELVALPEYFCLMGRSDRDKLAQYADYFRQVGGYTYDRDPTRPDWYALVPETRWADPTRR